MLNAGSVICANGKECNNVCCVLEVYMYCVLGMLWLLRSGDVMFDGSVLCAECRELNVPCVIRLLCELHAGGVM